MLNIGAIVWGVRDLRGNCVLERGAGLQTVQSAGCGILLSRAQEGAGIQLSLNAWRSLRTSPNAITSTCLPITRNVKSPGCWSLAQPAGVALRAWRRLCGAGRPGWQHLFASLEYEP